jgi:hypothetical protein
MVTWVLEKDVFAHDLFDKMVHHLASNSIPFHIVRIIPFIHQIDGPVPEIVGPCVVYGSIGIQKLAKTHGWVPGVFTDEGFNGSNYAANLGDLFLNYDSQVMRLSEVHSKMMHGDWPEFFIKPNGDNKEFAGTMMSYLDFHDWHKNMMSIGYLETDDFDVFLSSPKKLGCEWRVFVVDGKIVESSLYRQYQRVMPERHILPEVEAIVMEAHSRFVPAQAYVIDVAQVMVGDDVQFKIIEYNTLNSAGFYACEPAPIIDAINAMLESA